MFDQFVNAKLCGSVFGETFLNDILAAGWEGTEEPGVSIYPLKGKLRSHQEYYFHDFL